MRHPPHLQALSDPPVTSLGELFACRVRATPARPFLHWMQHTYTFAQAADEALRVARRVGAATEAPRVASFVGNRPEAAWTMLATAALGGTYIPLNHLQRGRLLHDMLQRARADVLVIAERDIPLLGPALESIPEALTLEELATTRGSPHDPTEAVEALEQLTSSRAPVDPAVVMFTSGTTGRSKAVRLSNSQIVRGAGWVAHSLDLSDDDVFHGWFPLYHVAGLLDVLTAAIIAGCRVALYERFSLSRFCDEVRASGATIVGGFANVLQMLLTLPPEDTQDLSLTKGLVGGISQGLRTRFEARFGVRLHDVYGMTEVEPIAFPRPGEGEPLGSCGRPSPDLEVAILSDDLQTLPADTTGEIVVRPRIPDAATVGYEGEPPRDPSDWLHTGDIGYFDAGGFLFVLDRKKDMIRRGGENISTWELEQAVAAHPKIAECVALAIPIDGDEEVKVVVVPAGNDLTAQEVIQWCEASVARFMIPRFIEFRAEVPRTAAGKLIKTDLTSLDQTWDRKNSAAMSIAERTNT